MCALFHGTVLFAGTMMVIMGMGVGVELKLLRCEDDKIQNPDLLAVVVVVSSHAREFDKRSELRRTQFKHARSLDSRTVFRPSMPPAYTFDSETIYDSRPACVQPMFVLSPWLELPKPGAPWNQVIRQDEWRKIIAESKEHQDVLIAPTIIDSSTRARELMHVLEWSRQTVPWADYIVSVNTSVRIHWERMIEIFPPPVPYTPIKHTLWYLGSSYPSMEALLYQDPRASTWRQCADVGVAAFSRDLVREMTRMPFSTQILYALQHPFRVHKSSCKAGTFDRPVILVRPLALNPFHRAMLGRIAQCPCPHQTYSSIAESNSRT